MEKSPKNKAILLQLDDSYLKFLDFVKDHFYTTQMRVAFTVNNELVKFYWRLGTHALVQEQSYENKDNFIGQLAHDMQQTFPTMLGFSARNLQKMQQFAVQYPDFAVMPKAISQLPWGHIMLLLCEVADKEERHWYANEAVKNGWSRAMLEVQIDNKLIARQDFSGNKNQQGQVYAPAVHSELIHELINDPYNSDLLALQAKSRGILIEKALVNSIRDFFLELGSGFSFVGFQDPQTFADQGFIVDLLFYHLHLQRYIVVELKSAADESEQANRLGKFLHLVNEVFRKKEAASAIGLLLVKTENKINAEYVLSNTKEPAVPKYNSTKKLFPELRANLPNVEEIETKLNEIISNALVE